MTHFQSFQTVILYLKFVIFRECKVIVLSGCGSETLNHDRLLLLFLYSSSLEVNF